MNVNLQPFRQRVDDRGPNAMQAAGGLITFALKLAAGVQGRHHRLQRRDFSFRMNRNRNAGAIVGHTDDVAG